MRNSMTRVGLAAMMAMSGVALSVGPTVEAGEAEAGGELVVLTQMIGADALGVVEGIDFELYPLTAPDTYGSEMRSELTGDNCVRRESSLSGSVAVSFEACELLTGSYRLGLSGVPDGVNVEVFCAEDFGFFPFLGPGSPGVAEFADLAAPSGFGGREILESTPLSNPDFTVDGESPQVTCFVQMFDDAPLTVDIFSTGVGHLDAQAAISVEAWEDLSTGEATVIGENVIGDGTCSDRSTIVGGSLFFFGTEQLASTTTSFDCDLDEGEYLLGADGAPEDYEIDYAFCQPRNWSVFFSLEEVLDVGDPWFEIELNPSEAGDTYGAWCGIFLESPPTMYLDAIIDGGSAEQSDFGLEVFAASGGALLATVTDPDESSCEALVEYPDPFPIPQVSFDPTLCAGVALPDGNYEIGATVPDYGYVASGVDCEYLDYDLEFDEGERIDGAAAVSHPIAGGETYSEPASHCTVSFTYVEQSVGASLTVENGFGGDADASDFVIEVFELDGDTPGERVAFGPSPSSFTLPVGNYVFGVSGPDGYEYTIDVTVDDVPVEALDPDDASFVLNQAATVTATLTATQTAPPTTTTTTTTSTTTTSTTTTTTSIAPTTAAPTTARPTTQLPSTGSGNGSMIWLAAALLLLGTGAMMTARRRSNMRW